MYIPRVIEKLLPGIVATFPCLAITGPQQFNMIRNLGDSLAGRIALLDLLPFAMEEIRQSVPLESGADLFTHACRIIHLLPPCYNNLGKRIIKAPKIYFLDTGLLCHLAGIRKPEQTPRKGFCCAWPTDGTRLHGA
ncbi:MAG: DUF4143 domain-containing protein [Desulfobacula sp.]